MLDVSLSLLQRSNNNQGQNNGGCFTCGSRDCPRDTVATAADTATAAPAPATTTVATAGSATSVAAPITRSRSAATSHQPLIKARSLLRDLVRIAPTHRSASVANKLVVMHAHEKGTVMMDACRLDGGGYRTIQLRDALYSRTLTKADTSPVRRASSASHDALLLVTTYANPPSAPAAHTLGFHRADLHHQR